MPPRLTYQSKRSWSQLFLNALIAIWILGLAYDMYQLAMSRAQDAGLANPTQDQVVVVKTVRIPATATVTPDFLMVGPTRTLSALLPTRRTRVMYTRDDMDIATPEIDNAAPVPAVVPFEVLLFNFHTFQSIQPADSCSDDDDPGVIPMPWMDVMWARYRVQYLMFLQRHHLPDCCITLVVISLYLLVNFALAGALDVAWAFVEGLTFAFVRGGAVAWIVGCIIRFEIYSSEVSVVYDIIIRLDH